MTRYDRIMADIDAGMTDDELARRHMFDEATSKYEHTRKNAAQCMHVYRMVHDGTLPKYADLTYEINRHGGYKRGGETIADRLARTIKGWHA